jgi:hypothetical protein
MKPPSQVGNGENYPSFDSPDRGVMPAELILGIVQDAVQADSRMTGMALGWIGATIALASIADACRSDAFTIWFDNSRSWRRPQDNKVVCEAR